MIPDAVVFLSCLPGSPFSFRSQSLNYFIIIFLYRRGLISRWTSFLTYSDAIRNSFSLPSSSIACGYARANTIGEGDRASTMAVYCEYQSTNQEKKSCDGLGDFAAVSMSPPPSPLSFFTVA